MHGGNVHFAFQISFEKCGNVRYFDCSLHSQAYNLIAFSAVRCALNCNCSRICKMTMETNMNDIRMKFIMYNVRPFLSLAALCTQHDYYSLFSTARLTVRDWKRPNAKYFAQIRRISPAIWMANENVFMWVWNSHWSCQFSAHKLWKKKCKLNIRISCSGLTKATSSLRFKVVFMHSRIIFTSTANERAKENGIAFVGKLKIEFVYGIFCTFTALSILTTRFTEAVCLFTTKRHSSSDVRTPNQRYASRAIHCNEHWTVRRNCFE